MKDDGQVETCPPVSVCVNNLTLYNIEYNDMAECKQIKNVHRYEFLVVMMNKYDCNDFYLNY